MVYDARHCGLGLEYNNIPQATQTRLLVSRPLTEHRCEPRVSFRGGGDMMSHIVVTITILSKVKSWMQATRIVLSLVPTLHAPPGEKRSGERSRISWAYSPKWWKINEIARSLNFM